MPEDENKKSPEQEEAGLPIAPEAEISGGETNAICPCVKKAQAFYDHPSEELEEGNSQAWCGCAVAPPPPCTCVRE